MYKNNRVTVNFDAEFETTTPETISGHFLFNSLVFIHLYFYIYSLIIFLSTFVLSANTEIFQKRQVLEIMYLLEKNKRYRREPDGSGNDDFLSFVEALTLKPYA